jgi:hypothetical protein
MAIRLGILGIAGLCSSLLACGESGQAPSNKVSHSDLPQAAPSDSHADHAGAPSAAPVLPPPGAKVLFLQPEDGAVIAGPAIEGKVVVHVKMGVEGITVQPAGQQVQGTGHNHIIVDGAGVPIGDAVPKDATHLHFGQGQTEAAVPLTPGSHTLTLQFADGAHLSYGPQLAASVTVDVQAKGTAASAAVP